MDNTTTTAIADIISDHFSAGIRIENDVLSFACSTLSATTPDELKSLLYDPAEYGEGLLDLVFSPDEKIKYAIEPLIPYAGVPAPAQLDIISSVAARISSVRIYLDYPEQFADRGVTGSLISLFLKKLNCGKDINFLHIPSEATHSLRHAYVMGRIMLRSMDFFVTEKREKFIDRLVYVLAVRYGLEEVYVLRCLELSLKIFRDIEDDLDIYTLVSEKIRVNRAIIERKKMFVEYNRTHSMEFLMSQKIYDPPENMDFLVEEMLLAEIINSAVFGNTEESSRGQFLSPEILFEELRKLVLHKT
jgi:hypothetical protein